MQLTWWPYPYLPAIGQKDFLGQSVSFIIIIAPSWKLRRNWACGQAIGPMSILQNRQIYLIHKLQNKKSWRSSSSLEATLWRPNLFWFICIGGAHGPIGTPVPAFNLQNCFRIVIIVIIDAWHWSSSDTSGSYKLHKTVFLAFSYFITLNLSLASFQCASTNMCFQRWQKNLFFQENLQQTRPTTIFSLLLCPSPMQARRWPTRWGISDGGKMDKIWHLDSFFSSKS